MRGRRRRRRRRIIIGSAAVATALVIAASYFGIAAFFRDHFFSHTKVNGWKIGGMDLEEAEKKIGDSVEDYLLTIYDRDGGKHHIYGMDIGCCYVPDGSLERILEEQDSFSWLKEALKPRENEIPIPMDYQEDLVAQAVAGLDCFQEENITEPKDAVIQEGEGGYVVVPEEKGNRPLQDKVLEKVKQAIAAGDSDITLEDEDYAQPEITQESPKIKDTMARIEAYQNAVITYEIEDYEEVLGKDQITSFISLGEDYSVTLKEDEIEKYVQALASKYNTYADVRQFKTSSGDTIEIGGGDYGWIVDKPKEAEQIKQDLAGGVPVSRELSYSQRPFVKGKDDIGNTYIEIDYTKQHMWYYENGELVADTDVVTGNISRHNGSPDGVFKIVYKESPSVLRGEDYESDVTYFMPFAYNVGIHDASWRNGKFGGSIYKTNGSHGCINAPLEVAQTLYERVEVGTPVIAYYREKVELTAENAKISNAFSYVAPETGN